MQLVEKLIGDLLLRHNCVIVPTFGGFVTQRVGARFDELSGIIHPPGKSVLFNRQLINNDGLLIATLSHELNCSFDTAHKEVLQTAGIWEERLKSGERISIDRVGFLYRDAEMNLCFEQDKFYNLLLESFGMSAIHFVSAEDATAAETHEAIQELIRETVEAPIVQLNGDIKSIQGQAEVPVYQIAEKRKSAAWKYAAAVIALPVAFYSVWIPLKTDVLESGMLSLDDFNPFRQQKPLNFQVQETTLPELHEASPQLADNPSGEFFSLRIDENTYVPVRLRKQQNTQPENSAGDNVTQGAEKESFVIVGCFSNAGNAAKLASQLRQKGFDACVLPAGNMTRVSAGKGEHFSELLPKLRAEGLDAWVLK